MIYRVNSANIKPGKRMEARQAALALSRYVREAYEMVVDHQILEGVDGPISRIHAMTCYESLRAVEEMGQQSAGDAKLRDLIAAAAEVIDIDNSEWHTYRTVE